MGQVTVRIVGVLIAVFFTALLAGVIGSSIDEPEAWSLAETVGFSAFALVFAVFGVFLIFHVRRRLVVEGGVFSYLPTFGRSRAFRLADIAGMTIGTNGRRLVGQDGRTLARFEDNQGKQRHPIAVSQRARRRPAREIKTGTCRGARQGERICPIPL